MGLRRISVLARRAAALLILFPALGTAATDHWTATSVVGAPTGRFNHTALWTGEKMIVWGGDSGNLTPLGSGGIYDPKANTWSAVSTISAPSPRESAAAVWTGQNMIVWGGVHYTSNVVDSRSLNDGASYDPSTDTWAPLPSAGAPSARYLHSAVWTGTEMIVWGGYSSATSPTNPLNFQALNTGAAYDPFTRTWRAISTVNAPSARGLHTAVWTGSRMIVWGGDNGRDTDIGGGGIYDPAADKWTPVSTAGEPSGRDDHTAVWTGSKMVVWGGFSSSTQTNTGGVFDPASQTWKPTSTAGAPSTRELHTAVWSGSRMIVWGGWTGQSHTNTGGLYDPATDSWTATTTAAAPASREQATAVWTGSSMIVWAGYDGHADVDSGGMYFPATIPCPPAARRGCIAPVLPPPVAPFGQDGAK